MEGRESHFKREQNFWSLSHHSGEKKQWLKKMVGAPLGPLRVADTISSTYYINPRGALKSSFFSLISFGRATDFGNKQGLPVV